MQPGYVPLFLVLLLSWKNCQEIILSSLCLCVSMHTCVYSFTHVCSHGVVTVRTHAGKSGWPCIFTFVLFHYGCKTGQRDFSKLERPASVLSPNGIFCPWSVLFSFFSDGSPSGCYSVHCPSYSCLQMEPDFSCPSLAPSLCRFMDGHPASRVFHPVNQRSSTSLNLQGTSNVHRAQVKILF